MDTQQGTLSDLHRQRLNNSIPSIGSVELFATIDDLKKSVTNGKYDFLIIDGTPRESKGTLAAGKISDLIVLPCCSSRADLIPTIKLAHELVKNKIPRTNIVFALSRVNTSAEIDDAREFINESGFKVLDGCIFEKPGYRQAQNDGYALTETKWKSLNDSDYSLGVYLSGFTYLKRVTALRLPISGQARLAAIAPLCGGS